jgi:hypothetical protein
MTNEAIQQMVDQWKDEFNPYFKDLLQKHEAATLISSSINLLEIRDDLEKKEMKVEFSWFIIELYTNTVFFPNDKVKKAFKELGFSEHELRWFTPYNEIGKIFPEISKGKFIFHPVATLEFIRQYLKSKIIDTVLKFYGFTGIVNRTETNLAAKAIHKFKLRTENKSVEMMSDLDAAFYKLISEAMQIPDSPLTNLDDVLKVAEGRVNGIYMKKLFNSIAPNPFLSPKETGLNEKYRLFFPLAKLIMKDHLLYSETEFEELKTAMYDRNYDKYRIERLKRILG